MQRDIAYLLDIVDMAIVWETVQNDLPSLISALEKLVPPKDEA